jgi:hypothetical protein
MSFRSVTCVNRSMGLLTINIGPKHWKTNVDSPVIVVFIMRAYEPCSIILCQGLGFFMVVGGWVVC